jgi:hypothetical protein
MACQRTLPDPKSLPTDQLIGHISACRAELERRKEELDVALGRCGKEDITHRNIAK